MALRQRLKVLFLSKCTIFFASETRIRLVPTVEETEESEERQEYPIAVWNTSGNLRIVSVEHLPCVETDETLQRQEIKLLQ